MAQNQMKDFNKDNILFLHIETTGLPDVPDYKDKNKEILSMNKRFDYYTNNKCYDNCRLLRLSFIANKIKDYIRADITINKNQKYTSVNNEQDQDQEPIKIKKILKKFEKAIDEKEFIIGYNIHFHLNCILNEAHRLKKDNLIEKINNFINQNRIICVYSICKNIDFKEIENLNFITIYNYLFDKKIKNNYNSKENVQTVQKIFLKLINNKQNLYTTCVGNLINQCYYNITNNLIKEFLTINDKDFINYEHDDNQNKLFLVNIMPIKKDITYETLWDDIKNENKFNILKMSFDSKRFLLLIDNQKTKPIDYQKNDINYEFIQLNTNKDIKKANAFIFKNYIETDQELQTREFESHLIKNLIYSKKNLF